ncbi:hypothetical protein V8E54_004544 [Elaphomyces granulatus]
METIQTVDVSWLHHSQKDRLSRTKSAPSASTVLVTTNGNGETSFEEIVGPQQRSSGNALAPQPVVQFPCTKSQTTNANSDPSPPNGNDKPREHKSHASQNHSSKETASRPVLANRRNSWISTLSSKFSSGTTSSSLANAIKESPSNSKQAPPPTKLDFHNPFNAAYYPKDKDEKGNDLSVPFNPPPSKSGHPSFLQSALRKFSSGNTGLSRLSPSATVCQRRVMNVDQNRDRCRIPELDQAKLKRVAFCVDVEIAGVSSKENGDESSDLIDREPRLLQSQNHKNPPPQKSGSKTKDNDRDASPKHPQAMVPIKETNGMMKEPGKDHLPASALEVESKSEKQLKEPTKKQEKKKKSEEERKERREKKRKQAEANGSVPLQLTFGDSADAARSSDTSGSPARGQSRPTSDPVRIYRRCCQLRETPVLKRLVERINSPSSTLAECHGTVAVLDLTDFHMVLQDIVTFSDWLAIVPVRKLILENCSLTDEGVRSILAGLLSTKTMEQARCHRKRTAANSANSEIHDKENFGVVEKLSLKSNPKIGPEGWRHICLFLHLSKSLKAIDLSGIPFPKMPVPTNGPGSLVRPPKSGADIAATLATALAERFAGDRLEELLLSECKPSIEDVGKICDAAITLGLRRLGLANNDLTREGLEHVVRYFQAGKCEGLDLGGNDLSGHLYLLASAINSQQPLYALSLADCSLAAPAICSLLQAFTRLPNFRFVDLSHNPGLFSTQPDALSMLRRYLPKMPWLKRIHLEDVDLSPDHAIALAEILPECPSLCHLTILDNPRIASLSSATDPASQEEACAVYASLMAAVRVSRTIIAVDIEIPSATSNEVVKALASQIVAYSLRNLEQRAIEEELPGPVDVSAARPQAPVPVPDVLQHLVGHVDGADDPEDDEPAPDEDYVIGGTGVVKALGVCLGNVDRHNPELGDPLNSASGASTPIPRVNRPIACKKPRDMSKNLLGSARNIRVRIQSALVREDKAGNDTNYRRLQFLDMTLQKMIQRFEDEYPETRIDPLTSPSVLLDSSSEHVVDDSHGQADGTESSPTTNLEDEDADQYAIKLSRSGSNTSLYSRAMTSEEGHIHRMGQNLRRDLMNPALEKSAEALLKPSDDSHIVVLRDRLEQLRGDQMRSRIEKVGMEAALKELGISVEDLWTIHKQDAESFQQFKESQIAAQINAGMRPPCISDCNKLEASNL